MSILSFEELSESLLDSIVSNSLKSYKELEHTKNKFAKAENYQKALELSEKLKNHKFFERMDSEELSSCYLHFLYELEVYKLFEGNRLAGVLELTADVRKDEWKDAIERLEATDFETEVDLINIKNVLDQSKKAVISSILGSIANLEAFQKEVMERRSRAVSLLQKFESLVGESSHLKPELWAVIKYTEKFNNYLHNIKAVNDVHTTLTSIIDTLNTQSTKTAPSDERKRIALVVQKSNSLLELLQPKRHDDDSTVHEHIANHALTAAFIASRNLTASDPKVCGFCGLPYSQSLTAQSAYKNICNNI